MTTTTRTTTVGTGGILPMANMPGMGHKVTVKEPITIRHRLILPLPGILEGFQVEARSRKVMGLVRARCEVVAVNSNNHSPQQVAKSEVRLAVDSNVLLPLAIPGVHGHLPPMVALLTALLEDIRGSSGLYVLFQLEWLRRRIRLPEVLFRGAGRVLLL